MGPLKFNKEFLTKMNFTLKKKYINKVAQIVLLYGLKGVGKDTIADIIIDQYPNTIVKMSFADPLKSILVDTCQLLVPESGVTQEVLYSDLKNTHVIRSGVTARTALQVLGTDIIRKHLSGEVFVSAMIRRVSGVPSNTEMIIIPDLRFVSEFTGILKQFPDNVAVIRVHRELPGEPDFHLSETGQDAITEAVTSSGVAFLDLDNTDINKSGQEALDFVFWL